MHTEGVAYLTRNIPTALAEVLQDRRIINTRSRAPHLSGFRPVRELTLLDLTGGWPLHIGASHVINTGPRHHCRAWARALRAAWPEVDGLLHTASLTAGCPEPFWSRGGQWSDDSPGYLLHTVRRASRGFRGTAWSDPLPDSLGYPS